MPDTNVGAHVLDIKIINQTRVYIQIKIAQILLCKLHKRKEPKEKVKGIGLRHTVARPNRQGGRAGLQLARPLPASRSVVAYI